MLRLWNRVGVFRALSVGLLVLGLVGGLLVAQRETRHPRSATTTALATETGKSRALAEVLSDQQDAQEEVVKIAEMDAQQAKAIDEQARKDAEAASRAKARTAEPSASGKPGVNAGPVPASCGEYSGNRATGCTLLLSNGFGLDQMPCLEKLWTRESGWRETAANSSGAYGIPQALPGSKMSAFGSDWKTNPATQIAWGLSYIKGRYQTPCGAWSHFQSANSY